VSTTVGGDGSGRGREGESADDTTTSGITEACAAVESDASGGNGRDVVAAAGEGATSAVGERAFASSLSLGGLVLCAVKADAGDGVNVVVVAVVAGCC